MVTRSSATTHAARPRPGLVRRSRGPVAFAFLVTAFWAALANAQDADRLSLNASFDAGGRIQVAYSLTYSLDRGATCAATPATPVTVRIAQPDGVAVSPREIVFDTCDRHVDVVFSSDRSGSHDVRADIVSGPSEGLLVSPGLLYLSVFEARRVAPVPTANGSADVTAPQWRCAPPAGGADWADDNVTMACEAWDDGVGLDLFSPSRFSLATSIAETEETADADTGTEVVCDAAGNCTLAGNMRGFKVDIRGPEEIRLQGPIEDSDSFFWSKTPTARHTCTAADFGAGMASCVVTGHETEVGSHVLFALARDRMGNESYANTFYRVLPWTMALDGGFGDISRPRRAAAGVPTTFTFRVFAGNEGDDQRTSADVVSSATWTRLSCEFGYPISGDMTLGGGVRTDDRGGFSLAWTAPRAPGTCHRLRIVLVDGVARDIHLRVD